MNLEEKTVKKNYIYKGKIVNLRKDDAMLPNGKMCVREIVEHAKGVVLAALTEDNELIFVRQFRYPYMEVVLELPAGKVEEGEDPLEAGKRELLEETGVNSEFISPIGLFSKPDRDPRGWVVSCCYYGFVDKDMCQPKGEDDAKEAKWFKLDYCSDFITLSNDNTKISFDYQGKYFTSNILAFDHQMMIIDFINKLKECKF